MNAMILPLVIGAPQIVLIVIAILLLFGGRKIPELMRGLGSGIKEFKDASRDDTHDTQQSNSPKKEAPEENK
ncbi:MAG: twin-arginine translocase TatA/TatE family subunit [Salegentibacter sp.]